MKNILKITSISTEIMMTKNKLLTIEDINDIIKGSGMPNKIEYIKTIQWTGDNFDSIDKFCGMVYHEGCYKHAAYTIHDIGMPDELYLRSRTSSDRFIPKGSYIFKDDKGIISFKKLRKVENDVSYSSSNYHFVFNNRA